MCRDWVGVRRKDSAHAGVGISRERGPEEAPVVPVVELGDVCDCTQERQ